MSDAIEVNPEVEESEVRSDNIIVIKKKLITWIYLAVIALIAFTGLCLGGFAGLFFSLFAFLISFILGYFAKDLKVIQ